jgi:hypothetical protein
MIEAQLRHMRQKGQMETAIENQQNIDRPMKLRLHFHQEIFQDEIRSRGIDNDLWHWYDRIKSRNHFFFENDETLVNIH